jgi:integrase
MFDVSDLRERTMLAMLASSGMRIGELLSLRVKDVEFENPTRIAVRAENTKNRRERIVFVSSEATVLLKDYLGERIKMPDSRARSRRA